MSIENTGNSLANLAIGGSARTMDSLKNPSHSPAVNFASEVIKDYKNSGAIPTPRRGIVQKTARLLAGPLAGLDPADVSRSYAAGFIKGL